MRVVGALYVFVFFSAAVLRLPIRAEGPAGVLARAGAYDPAAIFILDTWTMFGLFMAAVGLALLFFSRAAERARALVWTVMGIELAGIMTDINKLLHAYVIGPPIVWMVIHAAVIATGYAFLRGTRLERAQHALT
jgi:hypothetical protein